MTAFTELDWSRPDVYAIVHGHGLLAIDTAHENKHRAWLAANGYQLIELDFKHGISPVVEHLGQLLRWEDEFGYILKPESRNINALRDGFEFQVPQDGGLVLWLKYVETAWSESDLWTKGFLSIISAYSVRQLACGKRFYASLAVAEDSTLIGRQVDELGISHLFHFRPVPPG